MRKQLCERSLLWILNLRKGIQSMNATSTNKCHDPLFSRELHKHVYSDGHSGMSFSWTMEQHFYIERYGLKQWLDTEHAYGYSHFLNKRMFGRQYRS